MSILTHRLGRASAERPGAAAILWRHFLRLRQTGTETLLTVAIASIVLAVLFAVIGGALAWALGLRGFWVIGMAAPFTFSVIAIASTVAPFLGMTWSLLPVLLVTAVLTAGIFVVRRFVMQSPGAAPVPPRGGVSWTLIAAVIAGVLIAWRVLAVFDGPDSISQTFDNVFHLNAIRFVLEEGSASSLDVSGLTAAMGFYPAVWHATAALLVQLTGASLPVAIQALTVVISAIVWPLGAIALASSLFGATRSVLLSTAVISAAIPAFPLLMMDYGVLYPFQLSLALLPSALALAVVMLRPSAGARGAVGWWILAFAGTLPGLVLSHPGGFVGWLALSAPLFIAFFLRSWRESPTMRMRIVLVVAAAVYVGIGAVLVKMLRPAVEARAWPIPLSPAGAVWQAASVSMFLGVSAVVVAGAVVFGIVRVALQRSASLWVAFGMWAIGALLFVTVSGLEIGAVRDALTGSWYNNWPRLAALFAVALVPLAVAGLAGVAELIARFVTDRMTALRSERTMAGVAIAAAVVVAIVAQFPAMPAAQAAAHGGYVMDEDSRLLSPDELALIERIPDEVPEDAVIAGNPYTGAGLAYAFANRRVLMPHMLMYLTKDGHVVNEGLDEADVDTSVCASIAELGITHVLDFGDREVHGESHDYTGLDELSTSGAVELMDEQGDARLYRVVACGLG